MNFLTMNFLLKRSTMSLSEELQKVLDLFINDPREAAAILLDLPLNEVVSKLIRLLTHLRGEYMELEGDETATEKIESIEKLLRDMPRYGEYLLSERRMELASNNRAESRLLEFLMDAEFLVKRMDYSNQFYLKRDVDFKFVEMDQEILEIEIPNETADRIPISLGDYFKIYHYSDSGERTDNYLSVNVIAKKKDKTTIQFKNLGYINKWGKLAINYALSGFMNQFLVKMSEREMNDFFGFKKGVPMGSYRNNENVQIEIDLDTIISAQYANVLTLGTVGSGKTTFMKNQIAQILRNSNAQIVIGDVQSEYLYENEAEFKDMTEVLVIGKSMQLDMQLLLSTTYLIEIIQEMSPQRFMSASAAGFIGQLIDDTKDIIGLTPEKFVERSKVRLKGERADHQKWIQNSLNYLELLIKNNIFGYRRANLLNVEKLFDDERGKRLHIFRMPPGTPTNLIQFVLRYITSEIYDHRDKIAGKVKAEILAKGGSNDDFERVLKEQLRPIIIFFDEAHLSFPETRREGGRLADKMRLVARMGRKYYLKMVLGTQRPRDLDHRVVPHVSMAAIGYLTADEDRKWVIKSLKNLGPSYSELMKNLPPHHFLLVPVYTRTPITIKGYPYNRYPLALIKHSSLTEITDQPDTLEDEFRRKIQFGKWWHDITPEIITIKTTIRKYIRLLSRLVEKNKWDIAQTFANLSNKEHFLLLKKEENIGIASGAALIEENKVFWSIGVISEYKGEIQELLE